jgi:hypothetical protein
MRKSVRLFRIFPWVSWASISFGLYAPILGLSASAPKTQGNLISLFRNIRIFGYTVALNLILRIAMYSVSGVIMKGKVPSYASITP